MKRALVAALVVIYWIPAARADGNRPKVQVEYTAPVDTAPRPQAKDAVREVERRSKALRAEAEEAQRDDGDLQAKAAAIFDRVNEQGSHDVVDTNLEGWAKPELQTEGTVDGMLNTVGKEVSRFRGKSEAPPAPMIASALGHGRRIRDMGLMDYTDALNSNQLGVYVYKKNAPIGIYFNKVFYKLQALLGDSFAAATAIHEAAHARDHDQGKLNPKEVIKGEKLAYETEYWWMKAIDPKGQKLAWARVTFCTPQGGLPEADTDVCQFLEHLAKIMHYGAHDDFNGLVASLGYRDRSDDPFASAEMMGNCPFHGVKH